MVMHGFKSFPRKTEVPFTQDINVILGPNGGGKSNITDALCFVLGRLSIKSMRAARAKNLIFMGTKNIAPSKEAIVEIVFDNFDKAFSIDEKEISIKRIVRKNGQSIYKINNQTKTRQEILTLLSQAGIDPNGFNIILQGEIGSFVKMHTEERRKIIEEVSGISVYETRKQKSLKELEKTEEKLKEVSATLRERTIFLNNLEKERQQALKFKKLEQDAKKFKASIIYHDIMQKKKEKDMLLSEIEKKKKEIEKIKSKIISIRSSVNSLEDKINLINTTMQKSTGLEQEKINQEIANLRAGLAGDNVKLENYEKKLLELSGQKQDFSETIKKNEAEIKELKKESPSTSKKQEEINAKKKELEILEKEKKKFYTSKSELKSIGERISEKKVFIQANINESELLIKHIKIISEELYDSKTTREHINSLKQSLAQKREILEGLDKREKEIEKISFLKESEIEKENKLIESVSKLDVCPVCKSRITKEHIHTIKDEAMPRVVSLKKQISDSDKELSEVYSKRKTIKQEIEKHQDGFEKKKKLFEKIVEDNLNIEKKYETILVEVQEISLRSKETLDSEISFKQRELERSTISLKQIKRNEEEYNEDIAEIKKQINEKENALAQKRKQEEDLSKKFQDLIKKKEEHQKEIRNMNSELLNQNDFYRAKEQEVNQFNIDKARIDASIENYENDFAEYKEVEIIKMNREGLIERLSKTQETLSNIGSVNLRSLEVYDAIKQQYESVREKAEIIEKEKQGILKIIHEIDIKKKKSFLKTLTELNSIFSRNFSQISTKGQVSLELENKKDPFEGGVGISVKFGHGKYFDVTSLSGGEQTMVALSLIFAIQELNPYCFYILDEIDAALDKKNSQRLANLLKKYMQKGQYIVITHNDEIMLSANNLYGVSMHEGISKIISMRV